MIRYLLRRFKTWLDCGEIPCRRKWCGRRTVGFSRFCRQHTDEILVRKDGGE